VVTNQRKSSFAIEVEQALKRYQEALWLGEYSPLASPYFLGNRLPATAVEPNLRGQYLQQLLAEATNELNGRYAERYQTILREYYFHNQSVKEVCQLINLGHNSFHLNRHDAITALAESLIKQMNPALRLETPPQHGALRERVDILEQSLAAINEMRSVSLLGSSGQGKSVLGSSIASTSGRAYFWYTIRRGLNDQLEALLFALGYFLHGCGSSTLWLEMVAEGSSLKPNRLTAVVRYALEQVTPVPLLCIDEIDQLIPSEEANHVPIIRLLESLHGQAPLLLMGQQAALETDFFFMLSGLSIDATEEVLKEAGHQQQRAVVSRLHEYTQGNPRLLELSVMLLERGESVDQLLEALAAQPSVEFLLNRILQRLSDTERAIMMELAIFRRAAPEELWATVETRNALNQLSSLRLLFHDRQGGVALLPTYRALLVRRIPEGKRRQLHMLVATRRERYGDYTAVAYHLVAAAQEYEAIQLWYIHRQSQINQGQAQAARAIFREISGENLPAPGQETLALIRAELRHLTGDGHQSIEDIDSILWQTPLLTIEARVLQGQIANDQSEFHTVEAAFAEALEIGESIVATRLSTLHCVMGWRHLRERKISAAHEEAQRARYEVEQFEGEIQREIANYGTADQHFHAALQIAQQLDDAAAIARTANSLAVLYLFQGDWEQTKTYLQIATTHYEKLGKVIQLASIRINWAVAHNLAGEYDQALAAAQLAQLRLAHFGPIPPRQEALILQAMAEANLGLGNLDKAAMYVQQVVDLEEMEVLTDAYCTLGQIQARRQQWDEAVELIQLSIRLAVNNQDTYYIGYGWRVLGQVLNDAGRVAEAGEALQNALIYFHELNLVKESTQVQEMIDRLAIDKNKQ